MVPNSKNFNDIFKNHVCEVVEVAEERQDSGESEECEGSETTVISFFHQNMVDVNEVGIIHIRRSLPDTASQRSTKGRRQEQQKEQQGFGWFGKSLENGVYDVDDEEGDDGVQMEAVDNDPLAQMPSCS